MGEQQMERQRVPMIRVKNLYKIYEVGTNKVYALNGVDFTMYKGEFCAIVGPSGSGKSTLLNMLAGLEKPTKGEIIVAGKHMERMNENELVAFRRENVGFIFQSYNLLKTLNAVENVALPLSFRGVPKKIRNEKAQKYLKLVGLEKQMKHMANAMSGGQQQRVGIARALVVNPKIIFADEPTGNLDSKTTMEILKLMRRIVREQNQTLVMVTHDNHLATFADRQFHIVDGKILKIEEQHHPDLNELDQDDFEQDDSDHENLDQGNSGQSDSVQGDSEQGDFAQSNSNQEDREERR
ncbi:ABC transporter ATP-binding protein [Brotaphodocola sp.]|uniref:ABC transporter ATP-binding protein n=1 Tax=Brotaphodocola sp. TaxID=3073577 RepID=UPI003D7E3745